MKHLFRKLSCLLVIGGVIACLGGLAALGPVQAQTQTCTLNRTPPANVPPAATGFDTGEHVIETYNYARQRETPPCNVSLSIDAAQYDAATPQQQVLLLINAERRDRGVPTVQLDATLLSQIAYNHAVEEDRYNFVNLHQSPINPPNGWPTDRFFVNPVISSHISEGWCDGEIVDTGSSSAAAIYIVMYQDAADNPPWGHRQTILQVWCSTNWVGIGVTSSATYGGFYVADFLGTASPYTPPTMADTQPPSMNAPRVQIVGAFSPGNPQYAAVVDGVRDNSDGSPTGVAGVTGVVFYFGNITYNYQNTTFTTVADGASGIFQAIHGSAAGRWFFNLGPGYQAGVPMSQSLHAVAVDGSGNFTDCVAFHHPPACVQSR
jgi:hypothetical protein